MKKDKLIQAFVSEIEKTRLQELAQKAGMSQAHVIRTLIMNAKALEIVQK